MNTELTQQTDAILKAFSTQHADLQQLHYDVALLGLIIVALLIVIAFRRR